jgi:predicted metal-dependent phosphoesterase TrpH
LRLRLDLHIHTNHSGDSILSVDEAILRCRAAGLDGFAITNHDALNGVAEAKKKAGTLIFIPGMEITAKGGHILALHVSEPIPSGLSLPKTVELIQNQGATAVFAHPYAVLKTWVTRGEIEGAGFDAIEVANAAQFPYGCMVRWNTALAERLDLPKTGGSDAHNPEMVGQAYTVVEANSTEVEDIISSIKRGRTWAWGKGISPFQRLNRYTKARVEGMHILGRFKKLVIT